MSARGADAGQPQPRPLFRWLAPTRIWFWIMGGLCLAFFGFLLDLRFRTIAHEELLRRQQQAHTQVILEAAFEAQEASVSIGRILALPRAGLPPDESRSATGSQLQLLGAHIKRILAQVDRLDAAVAGATELVAPSELRSAVRRLEDDFKAVRDELSRLEAVAEERGLRRAFERSVPKLQALLGSLSSFSGLAERLSSEVLVASSRELEGAAETVRWIDLAMTAALAIGLLLSALAVRALFHQRSALAESYRQLASSRGLEASILSIALDPVIAIDGEGTVIEWNQAAESTFGHKADAVLGRLLSEVIIPHRDREAHQRGLRRYLHTGAGQVVGKTFETVALHADGREFPVELGIAATEIDGKPVFVGHVRDLTERRRAELAQREADRRLQALLDSAPDAITLQDCTGRYLLCNSKFERLSGFSRKHVLGLDEMLVLSKDLALPDVVRRHEQEVIERRMPVRQERGILGSRDSSLIFEVTKFPVISDSGEVEAIGTISQDITKLKQAEEQLRHAQKMEAIGQLTGGVAHDFNNLLGVLVGNAELLQDRVNAMGPEAQSMIDAILRAAERGSSLTQRLLAFSRQQALNPVRTDLAALIDSLEDMLRRTLGEAVDLRIESGPELWPAMIDPHQFENALINLLLNARDAMEGSGVLTIETANVTLGQFDAGGQEEVAPGDYTMVAVNDSGSGMSPEVQQRAFEPFFTTKGVGKGSGLGLSMVYGFIKQSNGHVSIYSEKGLGTTVRLYLPRSESVAEAPAEAEPLREPASGNGRVLVVEDNAELRSVPVQVLRDQGYEVLEAGSGPEAVGLLETEEAFDLLFTDVILPCGMTGVEIAETARRLQPDIRVLYTTGYAENALVRDGRLGSDSPLIEKPYRRGTLIAKVRALLNGDSTRQ